MNKNSTLTTLAIAICLTGPQNRAAGFDDHVLPPKPDAPPIIDFWYGDDQTFGNIGDSHPLMNVLGSIKPASHAANIWWQLNSDKSKQLVIGPDLHRLARPGDFNIEIDRSRLRHGKNRLRITLHDLWGRKRVEEIQINYVSGKTWPLPFKADFSTIESLQSVVEVIDGKWELTADGVRTAEPYYDRTFAFGDGSWKDMELHAQVIFHRHFVDFEDRNHSGPPYLSHAHTSFNMRWAGFPDDGTVPRRAWQNLGSLVALRCDLAQRNAGSYWWMHYGYSRKGVKANRSEMLRDQRFQLELEQRYNYRMRVETIEDGDARYCTKLWKDGDNEPTEWQMTGIDAAETVASGSIVFVVHHSDVTLCNIEVQPLAQLDARE